MIGFNSNFLETNIINITIAGTGIFYLIIRLLDKALLTRRKKIRNLALRSFNSIFHCRSFLKKKKNLLNNLTSFEENLFSERLRRFYFLVSRFWVFQTTFQLNKLVLSFIISLNTYRKLIFCEVLNYLKTFTYQIYQSTIVDLNMLKATVAIWCQMLVALNLLVYKQKDSYI